MKKPLKRFSDFLSVARYVFAKGFSASKVHSMACIFFEALSFLWVVVAAISFAILASASGDAELPDQLMKLIPEDKVFIYGVMGLVIATFGGALSKFLSNYVINISLPKVESKFYGEAAHTFAKADIITISQLDIDPANYLKRDLSINARYAMMVYRRLILTIVPIATLVFLLPILANKNLNVTLSMVVIFLVLVPVYYWINNRSNQITLDMEILSRQISLLRKKSAETILSTDFDPKNDDNYKIIAPTLANENPEIKRFFHMYGERFTMSEATNLTNTFVLLLVIGTLALFTLNSGLQESNTINIADFIIVLVVLRQVHTAVSRGLQVTNIMSRFYSKLSTLKSINYQITNLIAKKTKNIEKTETSVESLDYKNMLTGEVQTFDMRPGNVHLLFDNNPPSRLSVLGLKSDINANEFRAFIASNKITVVERESQEFSFADYKDKPKLLDSAIEKHRDLLLTIYNKSELQHEPKQELDIKELMISSIGKGVSYLRPRTVKIYELMIDLEQKLKSVDAEVIFLDVRALALFQSPYDEKALEIMKSLNKVIIVVLTKQNYGNFSFSSDRLVIVNVGSRAEGFVKFANLASAIQSSAAGQDDDLDDEMNM